MSLKIKLGLSLSLLMLNSIQAQAEPTPHEKTATHEHEHEHEHHHAHHHSFDHPEKWAKKWEGEKRDAEQRPLEVLSHCGVEKGMSVVDLGAGTGYFMPYLVDRVGQKGQVIAADVESQMVAWLNAKAQKHKWSQVKVQQVKADDPQLTPESVDRILIVNVWHHIEQRPAYLQKLKKALKPQGKICLVEIKLDAPWGPPKKFRLTPKKLQGELEKGGFKNFKLLDLSAQYVLVADL